MNQLANTIKRGRKFDQVLEGARTVFMKDGYEGASVDDIARAAEVSKATLYSYFPDKRQLFAEVARGECQRQADAALDILDHRAAPEQVLRDIATAIVGFFSSDFGINVFRICVAESDRFPDLGRQFYETGPALIRDRIADYFRDATARQEFAIDDFELAAEQYMELCKAHIFPRSLCGVQKSFSPAEIERVVVGAIDMFMARYGA